MIVHTRIRSTSRLLGAALICAAAGQGQAQVQVLARTGQPAPGLAGLSYYRFVSTTSGSAVPPPIASASTGTVFFPIEVSGPGVTSANRNSYWAANADAPHQLVVRGAMAAPGTPAGIIFGTFSAPFIDELGHAAFSSVIVGPGVTSLDDTGLWSWIGGSLHLAAREGAPAFGLSDGTLYADFREPMICGAPVPVHLSFASLLRGAPVNGTNNFAAGVLSLMPDGSTSVQLDVRLGQEAPGAADGRLLSIKRIAGPGGHAAYACTLFGQTITAANNHGIWSNRGGEVALVCRAGDAAPGMPALAVFSSLFTSLETPVVSRAGATFFYGLADGAGLNWTNDTGIWSDRDGVLEPVFIAGSQAPGYPEGALFGPIQGDLTPMVVSDSGAVTISTMLRGPGVNPGVDNRAVYRDDGGNVTIIAAAGSPVAGLPEGVVLSATSIAPMFRSNGSGDLFFPALVSGQGVTSENDWAMLAYQGGSLRAVCREGQFIDGWTVTTLRWDKLQVNAEGQAVFLVNAISENDPLSLSRSAIVAVDVDGTARIIAGETGMVALDDETQVQVASMQISDRWALTNDGRVIFAIRRTGGVIDELVLAAQIAPPAPPACPADYDGSGVVEVADIFVYLEGWFAGDADFDEDGSTTVPDIFAFLEAWFAGCPT